MKKVSMHHGGHVFFREPVLSQQIREALQIGNSVQVLRCLLKPERPIEIRTDTNMARVAGQLADVIDMRDDVFKFEAGADRRRFTAHPIWNHHPGIERSADYSAAFD